MCCLKSHATIAQIEYAGSGLAALSDERVGARDRERYSFPSTAFRFWPGRVRRRWLGPGSRSRLLSRCGDRSCCGRSRGALRKRLRRIFQLVKTLVGDAYQDFLLFAVIRVNSQTVIQTKR